MATTGRWDSVHGRAPYDPLGSFSTKELFYNTLRIKEIDKVQGLLPARPGRPNRPRTTVPALKPQFIPVTPSLMQQAFAPPLAVTVAAVSDVSGEGHFPL